MPAPVFKLATPALGKSISPQAKAPPPKKMTPGQAMARRLEDRKAIMGATTGRVPGKTINKANTPKPGVPAAFGDLLKELEDYRLKKNAYARFYTAAEKKIKEQFPDFDLAEYTVQLVASDEEDKDVAVEVTITKTEGVAEVETLDKAKLKRLVTPAIYDLCTVVQKGLIEEHAGGAVLKKVLTVTKTPLTEPVISIKSEKVKK